MANNKKVEVEAFEETFEEDIFNNAFTKQDKAKVEKVLESLTPVPTKKEASTVEAMQAEINRLNAKIEADKKSTNSKEGIKMAHKGSVWQATRTTTYEGRTILRGSIIKIKGTECTNRWLKKIKEFAIDEGFQEELNSKVRNHVEEDGKQTSGYRM